MESGGKNKGILGGDLAVAHPEGGAPGVCQVTLRRWRSKSDTTETWVSDVSSFDFRHTSTPLSMTVGAKHYGSY